MLRITSTEKAHQTTDEGNKKKIFFGPVDDVKNEWSHQVCRILN